MQQEKKWFSLTLRLQVFVTGFAVMALELLGSRLITPIFGNSTTTWGSLIGIVLVGLAAGYYLGGKVADRSPSTRRFSAMVFTGGMVVVFIPFISPLVLVLSSVTLGLGERYGPLLACFLILGPPTFVLGMVAPYSVRIATRTLSSLGNVSGNLYSISTIGSIVGTFGTVFVLIPLVDVRTLILAVGIAVMSTALFWLPRAPLAVAALLFLTLGGSAITTPLQALGSPGVLYHKETPYTTLDVKDSGNIRTLYLNGLPNSAMDLANISRLVFSYTTYFDLGPAINPNVKDVLFVGGGGFSGPKHFLMAYSQVRVDVAEIDPDVIATAQKYFAVNPDPRLTIFSEDGRTYLTESTKTYDLIILDAYARTYVPFHLMTAEFMKLVAAHLSPTGVVVSNLIGSLTGGATSDLVRAEYKTVETVFTNTAVFTTYYNDGAVQNIELVMAKAPAPSLVQTVGVLAGANPSATLSDDLSHLYKSEIPVGDVPVLTDGYAPVENLLNPLTGSQYIIEQQVGRLPPDTTNLGNDSVTLGVLAMIGLTWLAYVARKV